MASDNPWDKRQMLSLSRVLSIVQRSKYQEETTIFGQVDNIFYIVQKNNKFNGNNGSVRAYYAYLRAYRKNQSSCPMEELC